jgi:hypothetical protein
MNSYSNSNFKLQSVPSELNLTISHRLLARQNSPELKTISGNTAARICHEIETSYKSLASRLTDLKGDLTRSDTEKAYIISDRSNKWMLENAPRIDNISTELNKQITQCEGVLASAIKETSTNEIIAGGELRTFMRTLGDAKRMELVSTDPQFGAAAAAQPAIVSGVPAEIHARCVESTQKLRQPLAYAELQDFTAMRDTLKDVGGSMLSHVRGMMAGGITSTRVNPDDPAAATLA